MTATLQKSASKSKSGESYRRLMLYFAMAYLSQGVSCAQFGIIAQPIQFYLMKGLNLDAGQISSCMGVMMFPWVVKPFYGLLADFVPLFGYRRKSYLVVVNALAAIAFVVMSLTHAVPAILCALFTTALSMAIATALMVGVAVDEGRSGKCSDFFSVQQICYYGANIAAALAGGFLCNNLRPSESFHVAAAIAVLPLVVASALAGTMLQEKRIKFDLTGAAQTATAFKEAFKSPTLWLAGALSVCWNFVPSVGVPLYFFESKTLGFSQASIGQLSAANSIGMFAAACLYPWLTRNLSIRQVLERAGLLVTASCLSYLMLSDFNSAVVIELLRGAANLIAIVALYTLAGKCCPKRIEVSVMALLVAFRNLGTNAATFTGGQLFSHVFQEHYLPLVLVAAVTPVFSLLLLIKYRRQITSVC